MSIRSTSVNSVQFGPLGSLRYIFVHSLYFDQVNPFRANLVHYAQFNQIWSILSNSVNTVYLVYLGLFSPLRSIRSIWSISDHFDPIQCTYLRKWKKKVWVKSSTNYFNNISCNYMISFGYHNNLLKRMRIWIIILKLKNLNCTKRN